MVVSSTYQIPPRCFHFHRSPAQHHVSRLIAVSEAYSVHCIVIPKPYQPITATTTTAAPGTKRLSLISIVSTNARARNHCIQRAAGHPTFCQDLGATGPGQARQPSETRLDSRKPDNRIQCMYYVHFPAPSPAPSIFPGTASPPTETRWSVHTTLDM